MRRGAERPLRPANRDAGRFPRALLHRSFPARERAHPSDEVGRRCWHGRLSAEHALLRVARNRDSARRYRDHVADSGVVGDPAETEQPNPGPSALSSALTKGPADGRPGRSPVLTAIEDLVSRGEASAVDEVIGEIHRQFSGRVLPRRLVKSHRHQLDVGHHPDGGPE